MAPCPKLKLAYAVGSLRLLKTKTPPRATLRPRRRLDVWCAIECAGGELGAMPTPVPCLVSLKVAGQLKDATGARLCHIQVARCIEGWVPGRVQAIHQDDPGAV